MRSTKKRGENERDNMLQRSNLEKMKSCDKQDLFDFPPATDIPRKWYCVEVLKGSLNPFLRESFW